MENLHDCLVCRELSGSPKANCSNENCKYYICAGCIEIVKKYNEGKFKCLHGCDNKNSTNTFIFEFNDLPREIIMYHTLMITWCFQMTLVIVALIAIFIIVALPFDSNYYLATSELNQSGQL